MPHLIVNWKGDQALIDFHAILYTVENTSFPSQEKSSRLDHLNGSFTYHMSFPQVVNSVSIIVLVVVVQSLSHV